MINNTRKPDYLFEISWEICNKVGGINTVIATKAKHLVKAFGNNYILLGPDVWRETENNPAFLEDKSLFRSWRKNAEKTGLSVRIGRWNIVENPIVILVEFSSFMTDKNDIFAQFWEDYKLDSISGGIGYVESAMFGYAAGKAIESFCKYNMTPREKCTAHFHEWMSGSGILYLKNAFPQISTVFTTHATVVGRAIAGSGSALYDNLSQFSGDTKAKEFNCTAKHSLEKLSAQNADCFTTVSEITARECKQFLEKPVDIITPNGFEDSFVPQGDMFEVKRDKARKCFVEVASAIAGHQVSADALIVANSGRYEFKNKGIDIFINTLGELNKLENLEHEILAFILVPANNYGARKDLTERLANEKYDKAIAKSVLTHELHHSEYDSILNELKKVGLNNTPEDKVKVVYVPSYLDGNDGIFNLTYYDLLIGLDLTIFPSYYEPWGYTPLESLAFQVPTITTNLAGIGMWVNRELISFNDGIDVFEREVGLDLKIVRKIANRIVVFANQSAYDRQKAKESAYAISRIALWNNLIKFYFRTYELVLEKMDARTGGIPELFPTQRDVPSEVRKVNKPIWYDIEVHPRLPEIFKGLDELSRNLWWSWNYDAQALFAKIDSKLWKESRKNPIVMLKDVTYDRYKFLSQSAEFLAEYETVYQKFQDYISKKPSEKTQIAYFSMEFGISDTLKIYSGGLGILAGDYLKEASDANVNMIGIGFLYKFGYFHQQLSLKGEQQVHYEAQNYSNLPISPVISENGKHLAIKVAFPGRLINVYIWQVKVGRITLYLLDTEHPKNNSEDKTISHQLYGGDFEHRLKQEMLLGIGGIRAITAMGIKPDLYHCNEGHAALIGIERLRRLIMIRNFTFAESLEIVRASTVFTTHTPVPAGHDSFSDDLVMVYMGHYPDRLNITWEEFVGLGKIKASDPNEKFSMSHLAANLSQEVNGVSKLHGEVTKDMFQKMWKGYYPEELHIGYVTNGVHLPTWTSCDWQKLYERVFGDDFVQHQDDREMWNRIYDVSDDEIWKIRQNQRELLHDYLIDRLNSNWIKRHVNPKILVKVVNTLDKNALTIGFARRFATYKRASLLFDDVDRLAKIVNNAKMPVQFLFAGKAHPRDGAGQDLIKQIVNIASKPEFVGKILFLQDYDIELAKKLVQGVDIWLNTPTRPLEASGTSGMKAVMNGVLNFSVLDGWWVEGYRPDGGWALLEERTYESQEYQNELDSETIYTMLENEIVPKFYERNNAGVPEKWVGFIKNCIAKIAPEFTSNRMLTDYKNRYYFKLRDRISKMREDDFALAKKISTWKKRVEKGWESIDVKSVKFSHPLKEALQLGSKYYGEIIINLNEMADIDIGIEIVITDMQSDGTQKIEQVNEFELISKENGIATYRVEIIPTKSGAFKYALRMFPKSGDLPHRQDFCYVRWL